MASNTNSDAQGKKKVRNNSRYRVPKMLFFSDLNLYGFWSDATSFCDIKVKTEAILKMTFAENDVIITTQGNGWMNCKLMIQWIHNVLLEYTKECHYVFLYLTTFTI